MVATGDPFVAVPCRVLVEATPSSVGVGDEFSIRFLRMDDPVRVMSGYEDRDSSTQ
jgi:hypothetical protein